MTHGFTRQPVADLGSGEAARTSPRSMAARKATKASRAAGSFTAEAPAPKWRSISCSSCVGLMDSCYRADAFDPNQATEMYLCEKKNGAIAERGWRRLRGDKQQACYAAEMGGALVRLRGAIDRGCTG